eukprot:7167769-Alexandrium_andersonii.AAC.1
MGKTNKTTRARKCNTNAPPPTITHCTHMLGSPCHKHMVESAGACHNNNKTHGARMLPARTSPLPACTSARVIAHTKTITL